MRSSQRGLTPFNRAIDAPLASWYRWGHRVFLGKAFIFASEGCVCWSYLLFFLRMVVPISTAFTRSSIFILFYCACSEEGGGWLEKVADFCFFDTPQKICHLPISASHSPSVNYISQSRFGGPCVDQLGQVLAQDWFGEGLTAELTHWSHICFQLIPQTMSKLFSMQSFYVEFFSARQ